MWRQQNLFHFNNDYFLVDTSWLLTSRNVISRYLNYLPLLDLKYAGMHGNPQVKHAVFELPGAHLRSRTKVAKPVLL